jgi:hypothetical protein
MKKFLIADALNSLCPNSSWVLNGEDYENIEWFSNDVQKPTKNEINLKIKSLQEEYDSLEYQRLRAAEYPDFKEYLDGVVKGDQSQINAYIAKCIEVKEKYPKPEGV